MARHTETPWLDDPMAATFARGSQVVLRSVWGGRLWFLRPVTVVEDSPALVALYTHGGGPRVQATAPEGHRLRLPLYPQRHIEATWTGDGVLQLHVPGRSSMVTVFWEEDGTPEAWYVDLCRPLIRRAHGFDYTDLILDVVIWSDGRVEWKDEDELLEMQQHGLLDEEEARRLRVEGERVIEDHAAGRPPFDRDWEMWRPDPQWPVPMLPPDWRSL